MPNEIYQADPPKHQQQLLPAEEAREHQQPRQHQQRPSVSTSTATAAAANNGRPRTATGPAEIDETLSHPGSVRINVKGAFIVDQDSATPTSSDDRSGSPGHHDTKDIRLPNHTAVVSHIAIDVRKPPNLYPAPVSVRW